MVAVEIILGSESDLEAVKASKMLEILDKVGVAYRLSVISAHRNPEALRLHCIDAINAGIPIFIGVASMAAALPGAIAGVAKEKPVIGAALPSREFQDGMDALISINRLPAGVPVLSAGIGTAGLRNAALAACQILALTNQDVARALRSYLESTCKEPEIGIDLERRS